MSGVGGGAGSWIGSGGGGGGTPGGSNTQIQFNSSGSFGASSNFTFISSTPLTTLTSSSLGQSPANSVVTGFLVQNTTAATSSVQQSSPYLYFAGKAWSANSPAGSNLAAWRIYQYSQNPPGSGPINNYLNIDWANGGTLSSPTVGWTNILQLQSVNNTSQKIVLNASTTQMGQFLSTGVGTFQSNINVAGTSTFYGQSVFNGATYFNGQTVLNAAVYFNSTVNFNNTLLGGDGLYLSGGDLTVASGSGSISGGLTVGAGATVTAGTFTTGTPTSVNVSLVLANNLTAAGGSAVQNTPHLGVTQINLITQQDFPSGPGFTADGESYAYVIVAINSLNQSCVVQASPTPVTDNNDGNPFAWRIEWIPPTSLDTITNYYVGRTINGGGLQWQSVGSNTTGFLDDNSYAFSDSLPAPCGDYTAMGTTRNYDVAGVATSPSGGTYYSPDSGPFSMTDDNSGNPYTVAITWTSMGTSQVKILGSPGGSVTLTNSVETGSNPFIDDSSVWASSDVTITPTTYGITSDGSALNQTVQVYGEQVVNGITIYSGVASGSVTDPNDGQSYIVTATWTTGAGNTKFKVFNAHFGGNSLETVPNYANFDALTALSGSTTITPTSLVATAGWFKSPAASISDQAQLQIQNTTGDYTRLDFLDYTGTKTAAISADTSGIYIPVGVTVTSGTTYPLMIDSTTGRIEKQTSGFSGTGTYIHFTIVNGIITSAS